MLPITALTASLLALVFIFLAFLVIRLRAKNKVSIGHGEHTALEFAIRAHGNFAEYTPLALVLMACLEINGADKVWLIGYGLSLILSRLLHAYGMQEKPSVMVYRQIGMVMTFAILGLLALSNALLVFSQ